ncbi:DNA-directed RNA polymerase II core subunit rpo21 [Savitreella phatthalungensis]
MNRFPESSARFRRIDEVQFGILSPEEIRAISVAKIEYPDTMDESGLRPRPGGLLDPRLGSIDREVKCQTCNEDSAECPGHFGHLELAKPVFHIGFIHKIKKILECVCWNCGKLKIDAQDPRFEMTQRFRDPKVKFNAVWQLARSKLICENDPPKQEDEDGMGMGLPMKAHIQPQNTHGGCGNAQPVIRKEGLKLWGHWRKQKDAEEAPEKKLLTPAEVHAVFKHIPSADLKRLGLSENYARPDWMVVTVLPVPPPTVRPSIKAGDSMRSEDDLTFKLGDIIKANANVKKCEVEGAPAHVIREYEDLLQYHVATYMDNDIAGQPQSLQKSGRPIKSIRARLKGKEGRLRGNLMGKRVDFSARTVITGDPNLSLDEVGVPRSIARTLTYPERVTPFNIHKLQELVRNGPDEHPGAKYLIKDGERVDLRYAKNVADTPLQYGWVVERHLQTGDVVIFNRQPSLHKMSMMGHRVRVMPYSTFRLNLSVTSPYNADFDGDEMNLHVPQSEETRAEITEICMVPKQILAPQANKPCMGIVQDALCGIRKFTLRDTFMSKAAVMNILMWIPNWDGIVPPPAIVKPVQMWTGKQILSMVIPKGINLRLDGEKQKPENEGDTGVMIEDGEVLYGVFNKKIVGAQQGGVIHIILKERGWEATRDFFTSAQMIINYWLLHNGFSIGIGDTIADKETMAQITDEIKRAKSRVQDIVSEAQLNKLKQEPGMTLRETFESAVSGVLNAARDTVGKNAEASLSRHNNVKQMVTSGSKGSFINISQMSACVGQQIVEGKRIPFGFKFRTLPHFTKDDYSPESRGFVENSYLRGLTPQEFFFHAMAGREGLIDTAVKTAETGYIQRRLVKALEDVGVKYDGTVRNSLGDIIQFCYGEDGLDGGSVEYQTLQTLRLSDAAFEDQYRVDVTDPSRTIKARLLEPGNEINDAETQQLLDEEWSQLSKDRYDLQHFIFPSGDARWPLPVNLERILHNAKQIFHIQDGRPTDLSPRAIIIGVRELIAKLVVVRGDDRISHEHQEHATTLFQTLLRSTLATRKVIERHYLNTTAFEWVLGEIESRFSQSVAAPGEMCGTLAAQSIGEPATQMTLNTFHYAGVSSKNVTLGVPRLKEILNVAKNIKTPSLTIYLDKEYSAQVERAKTIQAAIEYTTLRTVTAATDIHYDPDPRSTVIAADRDFVEAYYEIEADESADLSNHSAYVLRLELDNAKMIDKGLSMADVAGKIAESFEGQMHIIWSDDNADKRVIRCRVVRDKAIDEEDIEEDVLLRNIESHMLESIDLRGIRGVDRVFLIEHKRVHLSEAGTFERTPEWVLETDGINLAEVMAIEGVDASRTYSNSFVEVLQVLGIEATRAALLRELRAVIEFDGSYVNYRHLALLTDTMTSRGHLMAITRHGINRAETGALMRSSFEETVEILMDAAAAGENDDCRGVSENIMLGQTAPVGTGEFDVLLDEEFMRNTVSSIPLPQMGGVMDPAGGSATPYDERSPMAYHADYGADDSAAFSPLVQSGGADDSYADMSAGFQSPYGAGMASPGYTPQSPYGSSVASPSYSPGGASPAYGAASPAYGGATSPMYAYATSPGASYGAVSPAYSPSSPAYSPSSPSWNGAGGGTSPGAASPAYSPQSPSWTPVSPNIAGGATSPQYSPTSPQYSPTSPQYSPTSPSLSPGGGAGGYSATSPRYNMSPTSPQYSPTSPQYSPTSPQYSPTSPSMSPGNGGGYGASPTSPAYSPHQGASYSPTSPAAYSPASPSYSPSGNYN